MSYNVTNSTMPCYQVLFQQQTAQSLVMRFYDGYGYGYTNGWRLPASLPEVRGPTLQFFDTMVPIYAYFLPNYYEGGYGLGYDQYAQYYLLIFNNSVDTEFTWVNLTGQFNQYAYTSVTSYTNTGRAVYHVYDSAFPLMNQSQSNPYVPGNPSVMAYAQPAIFDFNLTEIFKELAPFLPTSVESDAHHKSRSRLDDEIRSKHAPHRQRQHTSSLLSRLGLSHFEVSRHKDFPKPDASSVPAESTSTGNLPFYRLTVEQSNVYPDGSGDGCTNSYLFAYPKFTDEVIILRMKVPTTFFNSSTPASVFGSYMTHYFSISSQKNLTHNVTESSAPMYWGVNARQLRNYSDSAGYAYVFMTPKNFTWDLCDQQGISRNSTTPPIYTWGQYIGYALSQAEYAIILRYREPNPTWSGNPGNTACYEYTNQSVPLTYDQLGEYMPQAFGGSFADFMNGSIGMVNMDEPWPESLSPVQPSDDDSGRELSVAQKVIIGVVVGGAGMAVLLVTVWWAVCRSTAHASSPREPTVTARETIVEMGKMPSQPKSSIIVVGVDSTVVNPVASRGTIDNDEQDV